MRTEKNKSVDPFDMSIHKTEQSAVALLMHWMRDIIKDKNLDLGPPDVETSGSDGKRPDTVIYESLRSKNVLCVIEAKQPYFNIFNEDDLKEPARKKATQRKAKYFAVTNFKTLIWYNTEKVNSLKPEEEQIIAKYDLSNIENLDNIEHTRYSAPIKKALESFLTKLYAVHSGLIPEPKLAVDEFLVYRLHQKIDVLSGYYRSIIYDKYHKDSSFNENIKKWFYDQGWSFSEDDEDFNKVARQTAYLLVNKILFYDCLQAKRPQELDPLGIPETLTKGATLQGFLLLYFKQVLNINYETIFTADFIDTIAFPNSEEVVEEIKDILKVLRRYDFPTLGFEIIGRIFERLIPPIERHNLGQYFTNPDVVDLILKFCLHHEDDKIIDPSCGAGTFLVRAYQHKKIMNARLEHEKILETLWGTDIAKFPAHLATINLAINDLGVDKNYPNILHQDFFDLFVGKDGFDPEKWRVARSKTLGIAERDVVAPRLFDAIVGNPPYTRQEKIAEISTENEEYKENIVRKVLSDLNGNKFADMGKRAGIYAYFFIHGTKFLKDGGYFGFIVSNSWLDVDYGKGFQEFFLKNYKIITIIESKVERWFEEADINTCIIILQKCSDENERNDNIVRFVYLKKPLCDFIPPAENIWEKQIERLDEIDKLKKTILAHKEFYENDDLRIYPKSQAELWNEGFDTEENKYIGSKWGKYLRAPGIFFKILEKGKTRLVPLKNIAHVMRGFTTGANEFFYLTEEEIKKKKIEEEFWMHKDENGSWVPNYVIKSPRECKSIIVKPEQLKYRVLMIHKDRKDLEGTKVLKYIKEGERKKLNDRATYHNKSRWYDLGSWEKPDLVWSDAYNDRYGVYDTKKTWADKRFFLIYLKKKADNILLQSYLNSSIIPLMIEIDGITNLGEGAIYTNVYQLKRLQTPPSITKKLQRRLSTLLERISNREILPVFDELSAGSADEVSLDKVKSDRRELDKIIMGDILGLTDEEQLEVYRAVIDLVSSRLKKAKSLDNDKVINGIHVKGFTKSVLDEIDKEV